MSSKYFLVVTWIWIDSTTGYWSGHLYTESRFFRAQTTHKKFEAATLPQAKKRICEIIGTYRNVHVKMVK